MKQENYAKEREKKKSSRTEKGGGGAAAAAAGGAGGKINFIRTLPEGGNGGRLGGEGR